MNILLTILALLIPAASIYAAYYAHAACDDAHGWFLKAEAAALRLRTERDRVTVAEREIDALRRELRKLSGKFYAELQRREDEEEAGDLLPPFPIPGLDEPAPDFSLTDAFGKTYRLADFRGKKSVVLKFYHQPL